MNAIRLGRAPGWLCCHWMARLASILLFVMWLAMVISDGLPNQNSIPNLQLWGQFAILVLMFGGYALGWKNALWGGIVSLTAFSMFAALCVAEVHLLPAPQLWLFAVPSFLYLAAYVLDRHAHPDTPA
jgi:hypothetical protein